MSGQRKSLGVLQRTITDRVGVPCESVKSAMVRGDENTHQVCKSKSAPSHNQSLIIYEDPKVVTSAKRDMQTQTECVANLSVESQTDCTGCYSCCGTSAAVIDGTSQLDIKLLTQDEPPAEYWLILAERRREALEDALKENERVHDECNKLLAEMKDLRVEMNQLQDDNVQLLQLAGEAEYFASMLKKFTDDDTSCSSKKDDEDSDVQLTNIDHAVDHSLDNSIKTESKDLNGLVKD